MASEDSEVEAPPSDAQVAALDRVDDDVLDELSDAGIDPAAVADRVLSYRDLLDQGVDRETATALRREFSLSYSNRFGEGLEDRSDEVTGLQDGERDWVEASAANWEELGVPEYDPVERQPEDIWADHARPTPVTTIPGIGPADAERLADVGVTSIRQLSFVDASTVADLLEMNVMAVRTWRFQAREHAP